MAKRDWVEKPAIQKIFKEHPIMAHVVMAESSGNPNAINKTTGASGLAQLMPGTARGGKDSKGRKTYAHGMYGKTLTDAELFDPVKNLKFASEYLAALKKTFGTTEDALKAYNWGPGNYRNFLKKGYWIERKNGKTIKHTKLPPETRNYVKKIKSRVNKTSPFVKAATRYEIEKRSKVDQSAEVRRKRIAENERIAAARQLRLIKRDKGEGKMATPGQIKRLEQLIEMYKKGGGSKKMLAPYQKRLRKMKGEVAKPVRAAKPDPKSKLIKSSKTGKGERPSNVVSEAKKLLKKDTPTLKSVSSVVREAMAKDKARKATAKKTAAIASKMDAPGSGKTRAARPVTKPTASEQRLADIQREAATRKKERDRLKTIKTPTKKEIRDLELIKPGADAIAGRGNRAARLRKAAAEQDRRLKAKAAARKKERERLKTIKTPTKKQIRDLELIKPGAAAARKRERAKAEKERIAKARRRAGEFADTKVIKPDRSKELTAAEQRAKARREAGKSVSYGGDEPVQTVGTGLRDAAAKAARKKEIQRLETIKKPTKKEIRDLELIKPGAAAARKRERAKAEKERIAKARRRAGEFADTKVIKPDRSKQLTAAEQKAKARIEAGRKVRTKIDPKKRVDAAESVATFEPGRVGGSGMRLPPATKKPKTTSADLHADAPKPGMGFDAALAARKAGPKKEKVTEKRIADDVEGYDPVTGRPSGEDAPKEYSFKDLLGSLDITRADDEPEYEGRKHGGKVRKTKKKAKSRKRAALRGWGKALRGY